MTSLSYLAQGLTFGLTYQFTIESKNSHGYSNQSSSITLLCAFKPEPPTSVSTSISTNITTISWSEPVSNGSPITGYKIYIIQHSTGLYIQESVECDGASSSVISGRTCSVSLFSLIVAPYSLVLDESIQVKIIS